MAAAVFCLNLLFRFLRAVGRSVAGVFRWITEAHVRAGLSQDAAEWVVVWLMSFVSVVGLIVLIHIAIRLL